MATRRPHSGSRSEKFGDRPDAEKGNYGPRRMGGNGSIGDSTCRAGAASIETPAAGAYGRYQEAAGGGLSAWHAHFAHRPGQVQAISGHGSLDHLSRIRPRGRTKLNRSEAAMALRDNKIARLQYREADPAVGACELIEAVVHICGRCLTQNK